MSRRRNYIKYNDNRIQQFVTVVFTQFGSIGGDSLRNWSSGGICRRRHNGNNDVDNDGGGCSVRCVVVVVVRSGTGLLLFSVEQQL